MERAIQCGCCNSIDTGNSLAPDPNIPNQQLIGGAVRADTRGRADKSSQAATQIAQVLSQLQDGTTHFASGRDANEARGRYQDGLVIGPGTSKFSEYENSHFFRSPERVTPILLALKGNDYSEPIKAQIGNARMGHAGGFRRTIVVRHPRSKNCKIKLQIGEGIGRLRPDTFVPTPGLLRYVGDFRRLQCGIFTK